MLNRPNKTDVLAGVATFLGGTVAKSIEDPGLRFRVKIAAHLLGQIAREVASDPVRLAAEHRVLEVLLGAVDDQEEALLSYIESTDVGELVGLAGALRQAMKPDLAVIDPRFDTETRP
jgi:hypothetical protein